MKKTGLISVDRSKFGLTPGEKAVLALAAQGLDRQQIAKRMDRRLHTVATHMKKIYRKLGVHNRTAAVTMAMREGMLSGDSFPASTAADSAGQSRFCHCCGRPWPTVAFWRGPRG